MITTEQLANSHQLALRVAARFQKKVAKAVPLGQTLEKGLIRVHRYQDHLAIYDLTNAGKRGKKVTRMYLETSYSYKGDEDRWLQTMSSEALDYGSYPRFKAFVGDMQGDFPGEINMSESFEKGIYHLPAGTRTFKLDWKVNTTNYRLKATPLEFSLVDSVLHGDDLSSFRQDTQYTPYKSADAKRFYIWLSDGGERLIQKMNISTITDLWRKLDVGYKSH